MTRIANPDGSSSYYRYDSGNRLSEVESGRVVMRYSYDSRGRVIKVLKTTSGTQNGVALGISYPDYSTTEFRNAGGDDVYGNADDLLTTYQFNNYGQTVGTATRDLNGVYMGRPVYLQQGQLSRQRRQHAQPPAERCGEWQAGDQSPSEHQHGKRSVSVGQLGLGDPGP